MIGSANPPIGDCTEIKMEYVSVTSHTSSTSTSPIVKRRCLSHSEQVNLINFKIGASNSDKDETKMRRLTLDNLISDASKYKRQRIHPDENIIVIDDELPETSENVTEASISNYDRNWYDCIRKNPTVVDARDCDPNTAIHSTTIPTTSPSKVTVALNKLRTKLSGGAINELHSDSKSTSSSLQITDSNVKCGNRDKVSGRHFLDALSIDSKDSWDLPDPEGMVDLLSDQSDTDSSEKINPVRPRRRCRHKRLPSTSHKESLDRSAFRDVYSDQAADVGGFSQSRVFSRPGTRLIIPKAKNCLKVCGWNIQKVYFLESLVEYRDFQLSSLLGAIDDYTSARLFPPAQVRQLLLESLVESKRPCEQRACYRRLQSLAELHPPRDEIAFNWQNCETSLNQLRLPMGIQTSNWQAAAGRLLAINYMIGILEQELVQYSLASQRQIMKSNAFKWLALGVNSVFLQQLATWYVGSVQYGQWCGTNNNVPPSFHESCQNKTANMWLGCQDCYHTVNDVPKAPPMIDRLIDLTVCVSTNPEDCATRLACELCHSYIMLTEINQKQIFVTNISNKLVRLKLCQRILENHCGNFESGSTGSFANLGDLVSSYFQFAPLRSCFTPPSTPDNDNAHGDVEVESSQHSPEACEELLLLLFNLVTSYIYCAKGM